jgi:Na+-transporting NADH:ubiquinone oxidoreductase subunit NqrB
MWGPGGKHVFNPNNFGIVILLLTTEMVWVSPGQWGNVAFFGFLMACLGGLVVHRALRSDVAIAFVICYACLLFGARITSASPWRFRSAACRAAGCCSSRSS